jgi:hypothetical protein
VRVFVMVLIGLVVVLAILTELCLLQAAAMRRKLRAASLPTRTRAAEGSGGSARPVGSGATRHPPATPPSPGGSASRNFFPSHAP